jgi:hypothetical protein
VRSSSATLLRSSGNCSSFGCVMEPSTYERLDSQLEYRVGSERARV